MRWLLLLCASLTQGATFDVTTYGAVADGRTDTAAAIEAAILAAAQAGGGIVLLPPAELPYLVRRTIFVKADGIEISGKGARLLLADRVIANNVLPLLVFEGTAEKPLRNVSLRGLAVDANYFNQAGKTRSKAVVLKFVVDSQVEDVLITRAYVGLSIRRSERVQARRVTVTDYQEDAFDAGGDADEVPGGKARQIHFLDVTAKDAPRCAKDGNAFEIEDGAEGVLIENAIVEAVAGNGAGLRNHKSENNHSGDVELRNVTFQKIGGDFALFGRAAAPELSATNSYRGIRLVNVTAIDAAVAFAGPITGLEIVGGRYADLQLGFFNAGEAPTQSAALGEASVRDVTATRVRINGASTQIRIDHSRIDQIIQVAPNP